MRGSIWPVASSGPSPRPSPRYAGERGFISRCTYASHPHEQRQAALAGNRAHASFPEMFPGPLGVSLSGQALEAGIWSLRPSPSATSASASTAPSMTRRPAAAPAWSCAPTCSPPPSTTRVRASRMRRSSTCRRADEPFDQTLARPSSPPAPERCCSPAASRASTSASSRPRMREVSIGDYVLSGGELAAMVLIDACVRLLPGVVGAEESLSAGELRGGPVRVSAVHQAARVGGPRDPRRPAVRRPQEGRRVAPQRGRAPHRRAPAGPFEA